MRICGLTHNITLAMYEMRLNDYMIIQNNRIKGFIGAIVNKYLELDKPK